MATELKVELPSRESIVVIINSAGSSRMFSLNKYMCALNQ